MVIRMELKAVNCSDRDESLSNRTAEITNMGEY